MENKLIFNVLFLIFSLGISWALIKFVIKNALHLHLVQPPNHRSSHIQPTPSGGGLGIFVASALCGLILSLVSNWQLGFALLGLGLVIALTGLSDDISHIPARFRFALQGLVCGLFLYICGDLPALHLGSNLVLAGWVLSILFLFAGLLFA